MGGLESTDSPVLCTPKEDALRRPMGCGASYGAFMAQGMESKAATFPHETGPFPEVFVGRV